MQHVYSPKHLLPFSILLLVLFSSSCKNDKDPLKKYGPFVKTVMRSDNGAFRGLNFGDRMDSVMIKESVQATEADDKYLYYEYKIDTCGSFDVAYDFDESGLNEIEANVYINNAAQTDTVLDAFRTYFDDHFGKNETAMGYDVWSVKSEKYGDVNINLKDESADFTADKTPGKISISIYPDKN